MDDHSPLVPERLSHARSDVDAKEAFVSELQRQGFSARVTRSPADITADKDGERFYFEIKKTGRNDSYFGAATLTEWVAAIEHPDHYYFVTAQVTSEGWVFHQYSGKGFMEFSTIPPFKVFFQIPVGTARADAPLPRSTRSVRLTAARLGEMAALYDTWRTAAMEDVGLRPHSSPDERSRSAARPTSNSSAREADLLAFWGQLLPTLSARIPLFELVRAPRYPFMTKSDSGITLRLNLKQDNASVWLQLRRATNEQTEELYRSLASNRVAIEARFGGPLGWDSRESGWESRLIWAKATRTSGLMPRERWPMVQDEMVATAGKLLEAGLEFLPPSRWSVR